MKNKTKILVSSLAVIAAASALCATATYSLFTSSVSNDIAITSGEVNIESGLKSDSFKVYSAKVDTAGSLVDENGHTYSYEQKTEEQQGVENSIKFTNGGYAAYVNDGGLDVNLVRITPGDKVDFSLAVTNNSDVDIKYRASVEILSSSDEELINALDITFSNISDYAKETRRVTDWQTIAPGTNPSDIDVSISLPIDTTNIAQALNGNLRVYVEAVQSNAYTEDEAVIIGNVGYPTLKAAIAAVPTDGTLTEVTLVKDITEYGITIASTQNVDLDLNNHSITGSGYKVTNSGTLYLHDGTISANAAATVRHQSSSTTTVENVTITGGSYTGGAILDSGSGKLTIKDSTITSDTVALRTQTSYSANVDVYNSTISGYTYGSYAKCGAINVQTGTVKIYSGNYTGNLYKATWGSIVVTGGTFSVNPISYVPSAYDVVEESGLYTVVPATEHSITVTSGEHGTASVSPTSAIRNTEITVTVTPDTDYKLDKILVNGTEISGTTFSMPNQDTTVEVSFKEKEYIIKNATTGERYEYIHEAVNDADDNTTVEILTNCALTDDINTNKNVTLDLKGYTVTVNDSYTRLRGSALTIKNGSLTSTNSYISTNLYYEGAYSEKSNIVFDGVTTNCGVSLANTDATFKNCTIDASSKVYYAIYAEQGSNFTVESGTYTGGTNGICVYINYYSAASTGTFTGGTFNAGTTCVTVASGSSATYTGGTYYENGVDVTDQYVQVN